MFGGYATCLVERNPLWSAALVEIVKNVLIPSQNPGESRSHADSYGGANGLYRLRRAGAHQHPQQQDVPRTRLHFSQMSPLHKTE